MEASIRAKTKKARKFRSHGKVLLTNCFDCNIVLHYEFLPQERTVNNEHYLEVMLRLRETIRQKHTELWKNQSLILHHNKALIRNFLAKN